MNAHLSPDVVPEQAARRTDAILEVENTQIPVHTAILAAASPMFADLFTTSEQSTTSNAAVEKHAQVIIPLPGHTVKDVQAALVFIHQRAATGGHDMLKRLSLDPASARPLLEFAHKFDMKGIVTTFDSYMADKKQLPCMHQSILMRPEAVFDNVAEAASWAALAEQCGLSTLLALAELYMISYSGDELLSVGRQLSSACLLRMLHVSQEYKQVCTITHRTRSLPFLWRD